MGLRVAGKAPGWGPEHGMCAGLGRLQEVNSIPREGSLCTAFIQTGVIA